MGLKLGFLRFFRHKPAKKERQKEDVIAEAKQKLASPENQESSHFFALVKQFFSLFFKIKYNFDYTELSSEIQKRKLKKEIKESAASFLQRLQDFEYGGEAKPEELGVLIRDFEALVSQLEIKEETEEKKPVQLAPADRVRSEKLAALLKEAGSCLDNNEFDRAGGLYRDITRSFEMLGVEQKRRYYNPILKLHNQLALYYESKKPVETARPEEAIYRARETVQAQKQSVKLPIGNFLIFLAGIIENAYSKALKSFSWLRNRFVFSVQFLRNLPQMYKSRIYSKNLSSVKSSLEQARLYAGMEDYAGLRQLYGRLSSDFEKLNVDDKRLHYNRILWLHRQMRALAPRPAHVEEALKPKAEIPHPEILLTPVFSSVANAFHAAWNSAVKAFSGAAASSFLKFAGAITFFEKRTFASISRFIKNLSALPAKYSEYSYDKKLSAVKSRIEKANICSEAGDYPGLRSIYGKLSSDFKGLKLQDKRAYYSRILALHRQVKLLARPAKPVMIETPLVPAEKPTPISLPAPAKRPLFSMPEFSMPRPRISLKPVASSISKYSGAIFAGIKKSTSRFFGVLASIPEMLANRLKKYRAQAYNNNLAGVKKYLDEAQIPAEIGDYAALRKLYSKISSKFGKLKSEDKKRYYSEIMQLHNRIRALAPKPIKLLKPVMLVRKDIVKKQILPKPVLVIPKPENLFKPLFAATGRFYENILKSLKSAKTWLSLSTGKIVNHSLKLTRDLFSTLLKPVNLAISFPARYASYKKDRNVKLLSRMISEARKELEENDLHSARRLYKRIGAFFNRLPKDERLGAYRNIVEIHRKITILSEKASTDKRLARIDCLLAEAETHIAQMDIRGARRLYGEINRLFEGLPAEEKKVNYGRIIKVYDRILSLYRPKTS